MPNPIDDELETGQALANGLAQHMQRMGGASDVTFDAEYMDEYGRRWLYSVEVRFVAVEPPLDPD